MKKIEAIIRPHIQGAVIEALGAIGIVGATVLQVTGFGRQEGHTEIYRGSEYAMKLLPKTMIIVYLPDDLLERAVKAIETAAHTGNIGDGKIAVFDVERVIRIRSGDRDKNAL